MTQPQGREEVEMRAALWLIRSRSARDSGCTTFAGNSTCRDPHSGRWPDAEYGADQWCDGCIASAGLDGTLTASRVRQVGQQQ